MAEKLAEMVTEKLSELVAEKDYTTFFQAVECENLYEYLKIDIPKEEVEYIIKNAVKEEIIKQEKAKELAEKKSKKKSKNQRRRRRKKKMKMKKTMKEMKQKRRRRKLKK